MPLIDPITMSTTAQSPAAAAVKPSLPIELLPTNLARIFTTAHPAILLSIFYARFPSLVTDPVHTLLSSLLPLAVLQISYAVICLPCAGTSKVTKKPKPGEKKKDAPTVKPFTVFIALLFSLFATPLLLALQILFGAPITTHLPHTLLSSAHLSLLALFPLIYVHGSSYVAWREVIAAYSPIDEVFGGAVGCFVGAWLGAVPIPLDWDREWQKWPVTVVSGAYAGYVVGKGMGALVLKGRRIELD